MKKLVNFTACAVCLLACALSASLQAEPLLQHLGDADPATEGFVLDPGMSNGAGAAVDDDGVPAWNISGMTTAYRYNNTLGAELMADMQEQGWYVDWKVRDKLPTDWASALNVYLEVSNSSQTYHLSVGPDGGDLYVYQGNGGFGTWNQIYSEAGTGTEWHTYRMVVDAGGDETTLARVYIDGAYVQDITPLAFPYVPNGRIVWGDTEGSNYLCDANWAEVTFSLGAPVPEPSTAVLLIAALFCLSVNLFRSMRRR